MNKGIIYIALICFAFLLGCKQSSEKSAAEGISITGKSILIEVKSQAQEGDWFEIDGLRIEHQVNDTSVTVLDPTMYDPMFVQADDSIKDKFYTLGPLSYVPLSDKKWVRLNVNRGMMTSNLLKAINVVSNPSGAEPVYNFAGDMIVVLAGRLQVSRTDGQPLSVKLSKDYPALLSVVE